MAFTPTLRARHPLTPPATGGRINDAAGFASRYGPLRRSPNRAFDAGGRPGPAPDQAASLLPGLLAATRTGLTPASDDELHTTVTVLAHDHLRGDWTHRGPSLQSKATCRCSARRPGDRTPAEQVTVHVEHGLPRTRAS